MPAGEIGASRPSRATTVNCELIIRSSRARLAKCNRRRHFKGHAARPARLLSGATHWVGGRSSKTSIRCRSTRSPFGELVHEMLKRAVDTLEGNLGYARATRFEIETALDAALVAIEVQWPLERSVPPMLLWRHTLDAAHNLALKALTLDEAFQPETRSWTELAFGRDGDDPTETSAVASKSIAGASDHPRYLRPKSVAASIA